MTKHTTQTISPREAALRLGVSAETIRAACRTGRLGRRLLGRYRIPIFEVEALMAGEALRVGISATPEINADIERLTRERNDAKEQVARLEAVIEKLTRLVSKPNKSDSVENNTAREARWKASHE